MRTVRVGEKLVGEGQPTYIVAEAGVNHNGEIALAKKLIDAAKVAGADAVKFQTFTPDEMVTQHATQAQYQSENTGITESQTSMLAKLALSHDTFRELQTHAAQKGIEFLSTPFSIPDADFLNSLGISAFKVSSGDLTNIPFLEHLARFGKPIILSTGMATLAEVRESFDALRKTGADDIILLHCTSEYPAPIEHANLRVIQTLREAFEVPTGFSDHTNGIEASVYAASLGASVIEKHFTLDRALPGPDHPASLEPNELKEMIAQIRRTAYGSISAPKKALGSGEKVPTTEETAIAKLVRKGIAARTTIETGEALTEENIFIARPEGPLLPRDFPRVLGKKAARTIPFGTSLSWDMLE